MKMLLIRLGAVLGLLCFVGCFGPSLHSDDPLMRQQAMDMIQNQKTFFLIAMNIQLFRGQYYPVVVYPGNYRDDVRLMAVERLTDVQHLLRCASWPDGALYGECEGANHGVTPGDSVREAAKKRLLKPEIFAQLPSIYSKENRDRNEPNLTDILFPRQDNANRAEAFYDIYDRVQKDNPVNNLMGELLTQHTEKDASAVLMKSLHWLHEVAPTACTEYFKTKFETASAEEAKKMYDNLYKRSGDTYATFMRNGDEVYAWPLFKHIDNPSEQMVQSVLALSSAEIAEEILLGIKNEETLVEVYLSDAFPKTFPEAKRDSLDGPYGATIEDVKLDVAKRLLARIKDQANLVKLATKSELFTIRLAAIERIEDVELLKKIASGNIDSCPTDASLGVNAVFGRGIQWIERTGAASVARLQKAAIARLTDTKALDAIRKSCESSEIKEAITARMKELGHSDAGAICAATEIRDDLFSMLAGIEKADELATIADTAKLKAIRLLAALRLPKEKSQAVIAREAENVKAEAVKGKFNIGGFALDMDIQDVYALLLRDHADVKPRLYLDGAVCIGGSDGRDIAWANVDTCKVHWLTLPPAVVQRLVNFENGSFEDLEMAVGRAMGVYFGHDILSKGDVSQEIGTIDTVGGETLRFFKTEVEEGEDFQRSVRKAFNRSSAEANPLGGGIGLAFANALEDAEQAEENQRNASDPCFASRGAVQLQRTTRAMKGTLKSNGSFRDEKKFPTFDTKAIEAEVEKMAKALEAEMEDVNAEITLELEELRKESDEMARKFMEEVEREARDFSPIR